MMTRYSHRWPVDENDIEFLVRKHAELVKESASGKLDELSFRNVLMPNLPDDLLPRMLGMVTMVMFKNSVPNASRINIYEVCISVLDLMFIGGVVAFGIERFDRKSSWDTCCLPATCLLF